MEVTIKDIISLAKELPTQCLEEAFEKLKDVKEKAEKEQKPQGTECPHCASTHVVRNGKQRKKQAYLCRDCGKSFLVTATAAIEHSHSSETVWKQVISDTVEGISLDKTAADLDLSHSTVFNMRHKILFCIEQVVSAAPTQLEGVCEADETYILENVKGRKISENYHRKPRKHGAKAIKRGISDEYICVCTSVTGEGKAIALALNRATPSKAEISEAFSNRIVDDTLILCDGNPSYNVLEEQCVVAHTERINKVNGFHSFIKERDRNARGFATKYLNRYNALFSKIFGNSETATNEIFNLMSARNGSFNTISTTKSQNLLNV